MSEMLTRLLLALLAFYKRWFSPVLHTLSPSGCKFVPTCSEYAATAIEVHGPLRGGTMAAWRLLRCHPFTSGGFDPVPPGEMPRDGTRSGGMGSSGVHSGAHSSGSRDLSAHKPLP